MFNLAKMLIIFIYLTSICCFFVTSQNVLSRDILSQNVSSPNTSSQDMLYIYEEPIEGLKLQNTYTLSGGSLMIWMVFKDEEDPSCILPYDIHLRLIERTGRTTYIDLNYTFPLEAVCPINITVLPLNYNYIMIIYVKSNNGVKGKYGLIINYGSKIIGEIYLGGVDEVVGRSILPEKGLICIEKPDKEGIAIWRWLSAPDITTGEVMERGSGEFHAPNLLFYTFVDSFNFGLVDGGFGHIYILKYNEMGSSVTNDPNIQYWKIYVSFLREGTYLPTMPSLVYQTTTKLNNIVFKSCSYNNGVGNICIVSLNNTITNKNQSRTEVNYYKLEFLTTGAFVQFDMIPKEIGNMDDFALSSLIYGGFLVERYYTNTTAMDFYILDNNGNYKSGGSFGPEFFHYNLFARNGTFFGIKKQIGNKLEILSKPLLRLNNQGADYDNPVIESTKPAVNEAIDSSINEITIKYGIPVRLSTANISIFQLNDDPYKPSLLRQTISGNSKLCTIGSDNHTVHIPIFSSTFNQPNSSYYVVIENDFVISQARNEPLLGTNEKTWMFSTRPFKTEQYSESITGLLRLNEEGSSKFLQTNQSEFFNNIIQAFSKIIPVDEQRITTNGKWKNDLTSPQKVLLSFTINEAKNAIKPSSKTIFDNLSTLVKKKRFTALSNNEYTSLIDESASFAITQDYFGKYLPLIIISLVSLIILTILYFLARWKNPEGRNFAIFETALIMQDLAVDLSFTLLRVNNTPHLIVPNMVFLIVPHIVNFLLAINIYLSEVDTNPMFFTWISELPTLLLSICATFSAVDILAINTLTSNLFGLKVFSAPLSQRSRKIILWGSFINIFAEDIPQLIIQILYYNSVVTYDLIPTLVLISGGLVIINKLILRSYHAIVRWYHRRDKIRNFIRRLSASSIRSLRSNV
ncbi:hypothetical protein RhiirA4_549733 [Rhizophagus irregularis]|uniref:SbsA Ig-like domain-containing protein n=1 Tax=Rhizophagus irregularis TaxID=588596 RepID=A0A2I1HFG6_9GLOM|nr:hypothetical protein RhiirA4_549733 [Rhizophagus irregularis]